MTDAPAAVLDVLVVGGGPAGTAAAFRATELGMSTLVIDYDDLMKRIRDYSKDKLILPTFGGGDRMPFPKAGELIDCLCFAPIDKDEMCAAWKELYAKHDVPARVGLELTGLERLEAGHYSVSCWDHGSASGETLEARHVIIGIGRGVPRRFDIPGNTDGIAYRLAEPELYVGAPACVIGGGTSAAEAVIAISNAKAAAGDATDVYWSYRGDRMPRVSKALADVFFAAYVGHGNIRYHRRSEPTAIFVGDDRREYLAIRIDRRTVDDRPRESTLLEFPKESCIACIGEDIPESLLASIGIEMVVGGPRSKKRMVVNRYRETRLPNVYLVGDLLSQAYLETDDFAAQAASLREVKHRGNIKSALWDGVLVAQVIRQRLDGAADIDLTVEEADLPAVAGSEVRSLAHPAESPAPPAASDEPQRTEGATAFLVRVLPTGVEADEYELKSEGATTLGNGACDIRFENDSMLSASHASIARSEDDFFLRDDGGATGVFARVPAAGKIAIADGDLLRAGRQFLRLAVEATTPTLVHFDQSGAEVGRHKLEAGTSLCGRDAPITLDADDATLSRRHLAILRTGELLQVKDLKSVNGTYLRVRQPIRLAHGDRFRIGQQELTFMRRDDLVRPAATEPVADEGPRGETAATATGDSPSVTFEGGTTAYPLNGKTFCEVAEENDVGIVAECHSGICGSDPVRILSGREHLAEAGDQERETLEEICELEAGDCRLACMVRAAGPVRVEILKQ